MIMHVHYEIDIVNTLWSSEFHLWTLKTSTETFCKICLISEMLMYINLEWGENVVSGITELVLCFIMLLRWSIA